MKTTFRAYQSEDDFWEMRAFLRKVFVLNGYTQRSWHVARLEYARWHTCLNCAGVSLEEVAFLWEDEQELIAFLMPDGGRGEAHLCVHPNLRTPALEEEMLAVAEENLASVDAEGLHKVTIWSPADDLQRQEMLTRYGYAKGDWPEHQWRRKLDIEITPVPISPSYTIRTLGDGLELLERCYASGLGFHEGDLQVAAENRTDPTWYRNIQTAPSYRRDLDLVAVTSDGAIAAFATIWFDDVTRSAYFEPVATVPAHRKRGLGKALLTEGLHRLQRMGALYAFVGGYSSAANALYGSVMGDDYILDEPWIKKW
jgi:GNAT superfamily N-acetyltransferase